MLSTRRATKLVRRWSCVSVQVNTTCMEISSGARRWALASTSLTGVQGGVRLQGICRRFSGTATLVVATEELDLGGMRLVGAAPASGRRPRSLRGA